MTDNGFWARKMAKNQQQLRPYDLPPVQQQLTPRVDRPWWQTVNQQQPMQDQAPEQYQEAYLGHGTGQRRKVNLTDEIVIELDENGQYRPRKASHLRQNAGRCPDCDSPRFGRSTNSSAPRCFDCGYIEGRNIADANRPIGATTSSMPTRNARQISKMNVLDDTGRPVGIVNAAGGVTANYYGPSKDGSPISGQNVLTHINGV